MKRNVILIVIFLVLMITFSNVALAATGNTIYQAGSVSHRFDTATLAKGSDPDWSSGADDNEYINFTDTSLVEYQECRILTDSAVSMSAQKTVNEGARVPFSIYTGYISTPYAKLRVWNPYWNTSDACDMSTKGVFQMTF